MSMSGLILTCYLRLRKSKRQTIHTICGKMEQMIDHAANDFCKQPRLRDGGLRDYVSYRDFIEKWFVMLDGAPTEPLLLPLHMSCLPWSASSNRHSWFLHLSEAPATHSAFYLRISLLRCESESWGAWYCLSWRKPNIDREGNRFILQGDIRAGEV